MRHFGGGFWLITGSYSGHFGIIWALFGIILGRFGVVLTMFLGDFAAFLLPIFGSYLGVFYTVFCDSYKGEGGCDRAGHNSAPHPTPGRPPPLRGNI